MNWKRQMQSVGLAVGLAGTGCATVPKPTEDLTQSESALRSAEELGAAQLPQAALELKIAQDELEKARELMKDDHNEGARGWLLRSRADAELALALTWQGKASHEVQGAQEELRAVQKTVQ